MSARLCSALNARGRFVGHTFQHLVYSVVLDDHSLRSSDLSKFRGSFRLRRTKKRVGVLQPAAEGHLAHIVVTSVSAHFPLAVRQNLGHGCSGGRGVDAEIAKTVGNYRQRRWIWQLSPQNKCTFLVDILTRKSRTRTANFQARSGLECAVQSAAFERCGS